MFGLFVFILILLLIGANERAERLFGLCVITLAPGCLWEPERLRLLLQPR